MAKGGGVGSVLDSLAPLVLRVPLGLIFMAHGSQKLLGLFGGLGVSGTLKTFEEKLGIPPIFTILAMIAEFGGGLGVFLGCLTRLSAFGIACVMGVAIYKVHLVNGFFMNAACLPGRGQGIEYPLALLGMALSLLFGGGGRWGIDRFFWRR
ncbi:MAG TPA: DoxX family protein [Geobacteraceae bacterium]|nr:DoxX family protein [Geobacteraceae bacterium]